MDGPLELRFVVKRDAAGGYTASCSVPGHGLFTAAENLEELRANLAEVTQLYLDALADKLGSAAPGTAQFAMHFAEPIGKAA
jgi:hypothetical protein